VLLKLNEMRNESVSLPSYLADENGMKMIPRDADAYAILNQAFGHA